VGRRTGRPTGRRMVCRLAICDQPGSRRGRHAERGNRRV
jgi:hypothetical protein